MDCLVAVPAGSSSAGHAADLFACSGATSSLLLLPVSAMPASHFSAAAAMPPALCAVGSPSHPRGTMFLPRLHSIPEAAEPSGAGGGTAAAACEDVAAAAASSSSSDQSSKQRPRAAAAAPASCCSTSSSYSDAAACCSSSDAADVGAAFGAGHGTTFSKDAAAAALQADVSPAADVVANTWAISIRHFTDCVPITADSVCSSSSCPTAPHALLGSSPAQQQQHGGGKAAAAATGSAARTAALQQAGAAPAPPSCSAPRSSSSNSSLLPAADDDGSSGCDSPLLAALSLQGMDALEWQPWDRVATWLDTHSAAAAAVAAESAATNTALRPAAAAAAGDGGRGARSSSSSMLSPRRSADPVLAHALSTTSSTSTRQPQQRAGSAAGGDAAADAVAAGDAQFDAPEWWQESVKARLEEQREAFQSSWWSRLKILTGLAAHRTSCALHV